ncbi:MAG: 50S ribosomal protein L18 [Acidobacteria bacterium RBG_16_68_9]|nr:MAG: 50S ribosomal protein L18 [Acidobacteria bacterium RBG_16_68_9]
MKFKTKKDRRERIRLRQRKRLFGTSERPRLAVFRSLSNLHAQVIDDLAGRTIVSASSVEPAVKAQLSEAVRAGNKAGAQVLGKVLAERLLAKGIGQVVFDRGGVLYHGRVRALAEAAREAGLKF